MRTAAIWQANTRTTSAPLDSTPWGCKNYHWWPEESKLLMKVNNCLNMIFNGFGCAQGTCKWMPFWLPNMLSKSVLLVFVNSFAIFHVEGTWGNPELSWLAQLAHQKGTVPHCSGIRNLWEPQRYSPLPKVTMPIYKTKSLVGGWPSVSWLFESSLFTGSSAWRESW